MSLSVMILLLESNMEQTKIIGYKSQSWDASTIILSQCKKIMVVVS